MAIQSSARPDDGNVLAEFKNDDPSIMFAIRWTPEAAMDFVHKVMQAVDALKHQKSPDETL